MGVSQTSPLVDDERVLQSFGYKQELKRTLNLFSNFAVAFTYLSPVVGFYSLFAFGLGSGGPAFIWGVPIVVIGQLMVALVFAELGTSYPIAGALYQWGRRVAGSGVGWTVGWIYGWALLVTIPAVDFGGAPYVAGALGVAHPGSFTLILVTLALVIIQTGVNMVGIRRLVQLVYLGILVEMLGTLGIGALLFFHMHHGLEFLATTAGVQGSGSYLPAFMMAILFSAFIFYGFESAADVSEEVVDARRRVPKALIWALAVGGVTTLFAAIAFVLATPSVAAVLKTGNPALFIVQSNLGPVASGLFVWDVVIAFVSCGAAVQAAATRVFYSYARDGVVVGASWLGRISPRSHTPNNALILSAVIALLLSLSATFESILTSFAVAGIYISFQIIMVATLVARVRGWKPSGTFSLGKWAMPVNLLGIAYGVAMIVHLMQPIAPGTPFYVDYEVPLATLGILVLGAITYVWARSRIAYLDAQSAAALGTAATTAATAPRSLS